MAELGHTAEMIAWASLLEPKSLALRITSALVQYMPDPEQAVAIQSVWTRALGLRTTPEHIEYMEIALRLCLCVRDSVQQEQLLQHFELSLQEKGGLITWNSVESWCNVAALLPARLLHRTWTMVLTEWTRNERKDALYQLRLMPSIIQKLGGASALSDAWCAVSDVCDSWA
jgi:hypothetical protein